MNRSVSAAIGTADRAVPFRDGAGVSRDAEHPVSDSRAARWRLGVVSAIAGGIERGELTVLGPTGHAQRFNRHVGFEAVVMEGDDRQTDAIDRDAVPRRDVA